MDSIAIELHLIGIRARHLPESGISGGCAVVIMAGVAGALDPALQVGDVVIDDLPPGWNAPAGARRGAIVTQDGILATPSDKADLFGRTGALAVDMETACVRQWARGRGVPFVAVRSISDRADQTLDPAVLRLVDSFGNPRPAALAKALLARPSLVPHLWRLGADSKRAAARLGAIVKELVAEAERNLAGEPGSCR
jgi:adenosylhomocysteine nucleosidase